MQKTAIVDQDAPPRLGVLLTTGPPTRKTRRLLTKTRLGSRSRTVANPPQLRRRPSLPSLVVHMKSSSEGEELAAFTRPPLGPKRPAARPRDPAFFDLGRLTRINASVDLACTLGNLVS